MGIPRIRKAIQEYWTKKNLRKINEDVADIGEVDILSLDGMSIVHPVVAYASGGVAIPPTGDYTDIIRLVKEAFRKIVRSFPPKILLIVALDGPPPFAKLRQQKQRRYKRAMELEKLDGDRLPYDSNILTPGTELMFKLDGALYDVLAELKRDLKIPRVIYRGQMTPGEGEHKIMKELRKYYDEYPPTANASIIYGNDADLILLGLALGITNVYIVKDAVNLCDGATCYAYARPGCENIDLMREGLEELFAGTSTTVIDFVVACSLLGNDFLPRSPLFANIERGFELLVETLIVIPFSMLRKFFAKLSTYETLDPADPNYSYNLTALYSDYESTRPAVPSKVFRSYQSDIFDAMTEHNDLDVESFRALWYAREFVIADDDTNEDIAKMCGQYARGLMWVRSYYIGGQDEVTWMWYYPYDHAPLFSDLTLTFAEVNNDKWLNKPLLLNVEPIEGELRPTALHQLLAVLPQHSLQYMPKELHDFYVSDSNLRVLMPTKGIAVDYDLVAKDYQCIVIVPDPVYVVIFNAINTLKLAKSVIDRYALQPEKGEVIAATGQVRTFVPRETNETARGGRGGGRGGRGGYQPTRGGGRGVPTVTRRRVV